MRLLLLLALALSAGAFSQSYPSKPVRLIVPDGPGGPSDLRSRQLAAKLSETLGQPVIVDNRPGGSMIIGAEAAAKSPPDGYTLLMGNIVTHSLNPLLFKSLPYRPAQDFIPVTMVSAGPLVLVVNPQVQAKSLGELIAAAKARPEQIQYGILGRGSPGHLLVERLTAASGARFVAVPYKSTGTFIQDLLGGHLPMALNYWSIVGPHVKSGKLRALAVASSRRLEVAPEIPTFAEAGVAGIEGYGWQGIFVPAGTPRPILVKLHSEIARALNAPEIRSAIIETGAEPGGNSPEQFAAMIVADQERWKKAAAEAGIAPE
jgi:tripartite-type tricarboxylate transporter receptor subunit TctC